jgi:hypothetical protein
MRRSWPHSGTSRTRKARNTRERIRVAQAHGSAQRGGSGRAADFSGSDASSLDALRWGLVPHWAKDLSFGPLHQRPRRDGGPPSGVPRHLRHAPLSHPRGGASMSGRRRRAEGVPQSCRRRASLRVRRALGELAGPPQRRRMHPHLLHHRRCGQRTGRPDPRPHVVDPRPERLAEMAGRGPCGAGQAQGPP